MPDKIRGLLKLFNSQAPEAELHLAAYAGGIFAFIIWISVWIGRGPRDANLVAAMGVFGAAITGGLFKKGSNAPEPPKGDQP